MSFGQSSKKKPAANGLSKETQALLGDAFKQRGLSKRATEEALQAVQGEAASRVCLCVCIGVLCTQRLICSCAHIGKHKHMIHSQSRITVYALVLLCTHWQAHMIHSQSRITFSQHPLLVNTLLLQRARTDG